MGSPGPGRYRSGKFAIEAGTGMEKGEGVYCVGTEEGKGETGKGVAEAEAVGAH